MSSCLATGATCGTAPTAKALLPGAYGFSVAAVGLGSNYASGHRKAAAGKGFLGKMVGVSTSRFSARRINVSNHREGNFVSKSPQSRMLKTDSSNQALAFPGEARLGKESHGNYTNAA